MSISRSLHARFLVAVAWTALALGVVAALAVYRVAQAHLHESGQASVKALISAIEKTSAIGAYAGDLVLLRELADGLARHPHVARAEVLGAAGQTLVSSSPLQPSASASTAGHARAAAFDHVLASPFDVSEPVGRLQVWIDDEALSAQARQQALMLVVALILLLAGVLLVFNALALRLLSRPMHTLATALSRMQPGTGDRIVLQSAHRTDEVGTVTHAANRLLELQQHALDRERAMRAEIAAMEARYRGIFDSTSAGIFIICSQGRLIHGNPALGRLLGSASGDIDALRDDFVASTFCNPALLFGMADSARTTLQPVAADLELRRIDGSVLWAHCLVSVRGGDGPDHGQVEGVLYDISQRKVAEKLALHRAEHDALTGLKSRAFIEASLDQRVDVARHSDGSVTLMFVDLDGFKAVNDRWGHAAGDAVLVEAAQRLRALFKRNNDIVGRLGGDELVVVLEGLRATDAIVGALARELIQSFKAPFELPAGQLVNVGASVGVASYPQHATDAGTLIRAADAAMYAVKQSGKGGFVIATHDAPDAPGAASHRAVPSSAEDQAMHDPLTGLPDRRLLNDRLGMALARVRRRRQFGAVICVDIDHFKNVNVARGLQAGDELLREVASRFSALLRGEDTIARTGSDEFVVVIDACGRGHEHAAPAAVNAARKLLDSAAEPFMLTGGAWSIRASAGVSLLEPETPDAIDVLREAQLALRRAKAHDRGSVALFENGMMAGFQERLALEGDLRGAIGTEQLRLHLQIQTDGQRRPAGAEALLRWLHPVRGWVPPDQFIPLAESTGSIVELGRWVLEEGCRVLARMARAGLELPLSINISPAQFQHVDFVAQVRGALESSGARPEHLILEITENLLISRIDAAVQRMHALAALGVRFSIDDFGTGFSSLGYLRRLPLYEIKIDRSFIAGLPGDAASVGIVQSVLAMGSHLGLHVVAEGVETAQQAQFLDQQGCDAQQGWLHGRPAPVDEWLQRLTRDAEATASA